MPRRTLPDRTWPFGFSGTLVDDISWAGARFNAVVEPNRPELDRRREAGLNAVPNVRLLQAVASLPHGADIPWSAIDPVQAAVLDNAPPGVLQASHTAVRLELQPPVKLKGIFALRRYWTAIQLLGPLVTAAPVGVVFRESPDDRATAVSRAAKFGIGLAHMRRAGPYVLTPPRPRVRPSLARSLLLELLYDALLRKPDFNEPARP